MAIILVPLFSFRAHGPLGRNLLYRRTRRQNIASAPTTPSNPRTDPQVAQRNWFLECIAAWHQLTPAEQASYASLNPRIGANPAYLNFMKEWLMGTVPLHAPDHKAGNRDPLNVNEQPITDNIDLDTFRITNAGAPVDPNDYVRVVDLSTLNPPDYPFKLKPNIVRWVCPGWWGMKGGYGPVIANRIYFTPIFVEETTTYIRIGCEVTTLSAGTCDLRIFEWDGGNPADLILSAGTVNTGTTGAKEIVIAQELTRGYYFLAARCTGTPHFRVFDYNYVGKSPVAGSQDTLSNAARHIIPFADAAYADPAPAPDGLDIVRIGTLVSLREN